MNDPSKSVISPPPENLTDSNNTITAFFFYGEGCTHCDKVKSLLGDLSEKYPDLHIEMLEIYHNVENQEKFSEMSRQYGIGNSGIPVIFIGSQALIGDTDIINHFEENILSEKQRIASCTITGPTSRAPGDAGCPPTAMQLTPQLVIFSGLIDSINPCAFSVLIFLLISIAVADNRRRILLVGGSYVAAMFLFHLFVGIGLFSIVSLSGFSKVFSILGAAVAVVLGMITIIDVIKNHNNFLLAIPESKKSLIDYYLRKASLPAAFALGILAGLFGFSCTGGIYISILGLMGRSFTLLTGLPYLLLYNLVFVIPLVLVILLVAYGIPPERANTWRIVHRRALRLIVGLAMITIGVIIFSGWIG